MLLQGPLAAARDLPSDPPVETRRSSTVRAVYFPFLAIGHGLTLIGKYVIAYPVWFLAKPVYDTLYESSEDPEELARATGASEETTQEAPPR